MTEQQLKVVEEQDQEVQRFMFQFIQQKTGRRTEPFITDWDELKDILEEAEEKYVEEFIKAGEPEDYPDMFPGKQDFILLVAVMNGKQTKIPSNPLITVETFMEIHGVNKDG